MTFTLDMADVITGASSTMTSLMPVVVLVGGLILGFGMVKGIINVTKKGKKVG